jgi:hypothetical protein
MSCYSAADNAFDQGTDFLARGKKVRSAMALFLNLEIRPRYEATSAWIFDQMQNTLEDVVLGFGAADVDDRRILEPSAKEANDPLPRVVVQGVEYFVNHEPPGLVQHDTRKDQALLLIIGEFLVPARGAVKRRGQAVQASALKHSDELLVLVGGLGRGISKRCAQRSQWHIGLARHEHYAIGRRPRNPARAPGPQARDRPK